MEFNMVAKGIEFIGTTIKSINVENNIVDVDREGKRSFGLTINEPLFEEHNNHFFSQIMIDFIIDIEQSEEQKCQLRLSIEGAFISGEGVGEEEFKHLVIINGAAALIGIARGKIETISAAMFNNGKVVIPFINIVDYYRSLGK